jgi:hypothetical protein
MVVLDELGVNRQHGGGGEVVSEGAQIRRAINEETAPPGGRGNGRRRIALVAVVLRLPCLRPGVFHASRLDSSSDVALSAPP